VAKTLNLCPETIDICVKRNDTRPFEIQVVDSSGNAIDVTGATGIELAVSTDEDGSSGTELFKLTGVIVAPATNGIFRFQLSALQADQTPDDYFYDAEFVDSSGALQTYAEGKFTFEPDVTNP